MARGKGTDIEATHWYRNLMAVLGLIAAATAAFFGLRDFFEDVAKDRPPPIERENNIEIVLDTSEAMRTVLEQNAEKKTKWDIAVAALNTHIDLHVSPEDNLAFRVFPGKSGDNSEQRFNFGQNESKFHAAPGELPEALKGIELRGASEPLPAIRDATGDFQTLQPMESERKARRKLIVITGSVGSRYPLDTETNCTRIRQFADEAGLDDKSTLNFIGLGLQRQEQSLLKECAEQAGAWAYIANSEEEATRAFGRAFESEEPVTTPAPETTSGPRPPEVPIPLASPPKRIGGADPPFPRRTQAPWGQATLEIIIDARGNVTNVRTITATTPVFEKAAVDAVRQWKYEPTRFKGVPYPAKTTLVVPFGSR